MPFDDVLIGGAVAVIDGATTERISIHFLNLFTLFNVGLQNS